MLIEGETNYFFECGQSGFANLTLELIDNLQREMLLSRHPIGALISTEAVINQ